jgi:hypothetical protein
VAVWALYLYHFTHFTHVVIAAHFRGASDCTGHQNVGSLGGPVWMQFQRRSVGARHGFSACFSQSSLRPLAEGVNHLCL